jgi:membrane-anchored mycosin MYCP
MSTVRTLTAVHRRARGRSLGSALAVGALAAGMAVVPAVPTAAAPSSSYDCATGGNAPTKNEPWAQEMLDPNRVWPFSTGAGVKVAVLAGGVYGNQAQLRGHVTTGQVISSGSSSKHANTDCSGVGTQVAGIIVARNVSGNGFRGLAPGASVVPIRIGDDLQAESVSGSQDVGIEPDVLAAGIEAAIAQHADIIDITTVPSGNGDANLHQAVDDALNHDIVVVSAVGDNSKTRDVGFARYPACYQGVIGVGAISRSGALFASQRPNSCVDLVAPGVNVASAQYPYGMVKATGTHMASAFVAATAALVRAAYPNLSQAEVKQRLDATAAPAGGGVGSQFGHGVIDPYQAVTGSMMTSSPTPPPNMAYQKPSKAEVSWAEEWSSSARLAGLMAGTGVLLALLVVLAAIAIPRGRRNGWRARQAGPPVDDPEADLPSPPVELFQDTDSAAR